MEQREYEYDDDYVAGQGKKRTAEQWAERLDDGEFDAATDLAAFIRNQAQRLADAERDYGQARADLTEANGQLITDAKTIASQMTSLADAEALILRIVAGMDAPIPMIHGALQEARAFLAKRGKADD